MALFQGIAGGRRRDSLRPQDHPRSRGVYTRSPGAPRRWRGSSPLARGLLGCALLEGGVVRIIPARAGFTLVHLGGPGAVRDHPRSRGVYACFQETVAVRPGSSPLARGLQAGAGRLDHHPRIIPARAGFTQSRDHHPRPTQDHPRSRGVYDHPILRRITIDGSSPLARGLLHDIAGGHGCGRIIPARAGFTISSVGSSVIWEDHPRSRGVY